MSTAASSPVAMFSINSSPSQPQYQQSIGNAVNDERSLVKETHSAGDLVAPARRQEPAGLELSDVGSLKSALKKTRSVSPSSAKVLFTERPKSPRYSSVSSLKSKVSSLSSTIYQHLQPPAPVLQNPAPQPAETVAPQQQEHDQDNERVSILIQENDSLLTQLRLREEQITSLQASLSKLNPFEFDTLRNQNTALKGQVDQFHSSLLAMEQELKECRRDVVLAQSDCDQWKNEYKVKLREMEGIHTKWLDSKKALNELSDRYNAQLQESAAMTARERDLIEEVRMKSLEQETSHSQLTQLMEKTTLLTHENEALNSMVKSLESKMKELERREISMIEEGHRRAHEAEEACFERDKAMEREQQLKRELEKLNQKLLEMPQFYIDKNQKEIDALRMQFQADRRRHGEEMSKLEILCANLQSQIDRAIREKRAAESELEKLTLHLPGETDRLTMTIEELHVKLRASERERNESLHRLESMTQKLAREQNRFELERSQLSARADEAYRRLRKNEKDLEEEKQDKIQLLKQLATLEHEKRNLSDAKAKLEIDFENERNALKQRHEDQITELNERLASLNEANTRSSREMQQMISDQKRLGDKWKEESAHISEHYEAALSTLRGQLIQHQSRISELESQVQKAVSQRRDLIEQMTEEKKSYALLHNRYIESENRLDLLGRQINVLVAKEAELLESRKMTQRELDKVTLERDRLQRIARQDKLNDNLSNEKRKEHIAAVIAGNPEQHFQNDIQGIKELEMQIERVKQRSRAHQYKDIRTGLDSPDDSDT